MKFKEPFFVPKGTGITEKYLYRVLTSSICSILLCIGCLAGTTWAWFAVSIENTDNVIQIGVPSVSLFVESSELLSGTELAAGEYNIVIKHANDADVFDRKSTLYVTFSANEAVAGYVILSGENDYMTEVKIAADRSCRVSWTVSWFAPDNAEPIEGNVLYLTNEDATVPTVETTVPTEETAGSTEATTAPTEPETEPTEETATPTESVTEPTIAPTAPTEETAMPTGTETEPSEEIPDPTQSAIVPTSEATEPDAAQ